MSENTPENPMVARIAFAKTFAEAKMIEEFAPETPPAHAFDVLWHMELEDGWKIYFSTGIDTIKRYLVTYTTSTDSATVEVITDGRG